jgi:hypothetical protein
MASPLLYQGIMLRRLMCLLSAVVLLGTAAWAAPQVAVIEDAPWSPNDVSRDGAAELEVMLRVAQLQQENQTVGVVGVGDKRGLFQDGTRRGLEMAVQHGVPVVRLARGMQACLKGVDDLFINGGMLSPEAACALLAECLTRHGALPSIRATGQPNEKELLALRRKLQLYQAEFTARQPALFASR